MMARITSRIGVTQRINFKPYTFDQIQSIIEKRLEGLKIFAPKAVELCSRKIASVSGDLRMALQTCRQAISIVRMKHMSSAQSEQQKPVLISREDILAALSSIVFDTKPPMISGLSAHPKIFLCALYLHLNHSVDVDKNTGEVPFKDVALRYQILARDLPFVYGLAEINGICNLLQSLGIIASSLPHDKVSLWYFQKIRLQMGIMELRTALELDPKINSMLKT